MYSSEIIRPASPQQTKTSVIFVKSKKASKGGTLRLSRASYSSSRRTGGGGGGGGEEWADEYEREVASYYKAFGAKPQLGVVKGARQWLLSPHIELKDTMYIGGKGLLVLAPLLARNRLLTLLGLANNGLTNESLVFFCRSLLFFVKERHNCEGNASTEERGGSDDDDDNGHDVSLLEELDLTGNKLLGVAAGVALLSLVNDAAFRHVRVIKMEGTSIPPALQHKLNSILRVRPARAPRPRRSTISVEDTHIVPLNDYLCRRKSSLHHHDGPSVVSAAAAAAISSSPSSADAIVASSDGRAVGRRAPPRARPTHNHSGQHHHHSRSVNNSQLPKEAQWARHETTSTNFLRHALEEIREAQGPYDPLRLPYVDDNWCVVQVALVVAPQLFASELELLLTDVFPALNRELHEYRLQVEPVVVDYTKLSERLQGEAVEEDVVEDLLRSRFVTLVLVGDRTGDEDILFDQQPELPEGAEKDERDVCSISALYRAHRIATMHSAFVMVATRQPTLALQLPPTLAPLYSNDPSLCLPDPFQPTTTTTTTTTACMKELRRCFYKDKHDTLTFFKSFVQEDSTIPELHVMSYPALYDHVDERSGTVRLSHLEMFREAVFRRLLILLTSSIAAGEAQVRDTHPEDFSGTRALEREVLKIYKQKALDVLYREGISSAHLGDLPFGPGDEKAGQYVGTCAPIYRYLATLPFNSYSAVFSNVVVRRMVEYMIHPAAFYDFSRFDGTQRDIFPPVVLLESVEPYASAAHLFRLVTAGTHPPPPGDNPNESALYSPEDIPHLLVAAHSTSSTVVREEPSDLRDVLVHLIQQFTEDPAVLAYVRQEIDITVLSFFFRQLLATYEHDDVVCEAPLSSDGTPGSRRSTPQSRFSPPPTKPVVLAILLDGIDAIEYPNVPCPALRYDAATGADLWTASTEYLPLPLQQQPPHPQQRPNRNHLVLDSSSATAASILSQNDVDPQDGGMGEEEGGHISTSLARKKALRKTTSLLEFIPPQLPLQVRFIATTQSNSLALKVLKGRGEDAVHVAQLRELGDYELINSMHKADCEGKDAKTFADDFDKVEQDRVDIFLGRLALLEINFSDEEKQLVGAKLWVAKNDEEYAYYMFYGLLREQERQWRILSNENKDNNQNNRSMLFEESRNDLAEISYAQWLRDFPETSLAAAGLLHSALLAEFGAAVVQPLLGLLQVARWGLPLSDIRQLFPLLSIADLNRLLRHLRPALEPANVFEHEVRLRENQLFAKVRLYSRAFQLHLNRLHAMEGEGVDAARQRWHFLLAQHFLVSSLYKSPTCDCNLSIPERQAVFGVKDSTILSVAPVYVAAFLNERSTASGFPKERHGAKEIIYHACCSHLWPLVDHIILTFSFITLVFRQGLLYNVVRDLVYAFNKRAEQLTLQGGPAGAAAQTHVPALPSELQRMKEYILFLRDPHTRRRLVDNPLLVLQVALEGGQSYTAVYRDAQACRRMVQGSSLRSVLLTDTTQRQQFSLEERTRRQLRKTPFLGYFLPVSSGSPMSSHFRAVNDVRFFANDRYIVTGGTDRAVTWFSTGKPRCPIEDEEDDEQDEQAGASNALLRFSMRQPTSAIQQVLVSPTCNYVVAVAESRIIYIYDGETARLVGHCGVWNKTEEGARPSQTEVDENGRPTAPKGEQMASMFTAPIADVQFSSRGRYLLVLTKDVKCYVFRTEKGILLDVLTAEDLIPSMAEAVHFVQRDDGGRTVAEKEELLRMVWRDFYAVEHHLHVLPHCEGGEEEVFYTFTDEMMCGWRLEIDEMVAPAAGDPSTTQGHAWRERSDRIYAMAFHTAATANATNRDAAVGGALRSAIETRMKYSAWRATCWLHHSLVSPLRAVCWYPSPMKAATATYKVHRPHFLLLTPLELPFAQLLHLHEGTAWCTFSWEPNTWQRASVVTAQASQVRDLQLCPRGEVLAASFADGRVLLYTVRMSSILSFHTSRGAARWGDDGINTSSHETVRPPLMVCPFARLDAFSLCDDPFISRMRFFSFELQADVPNFTSRQQQQQQQQQGRPTKPLRAAKLALFAVGNKHSLRYWDVTALLPQGLEAEEVEEELGDGLLLDDAWHTVKESADGEYVSANPILSWDVSPVGKCLAVVDLVHPACAAGQGSGSTNGAPAYANETRRKKVDLAIGEEGGNVTFLQFT